jgi:hypothetical protein
MKSLILFGYLAYRIEGRNILNDLEAAETLSKVKFSQRLLTAFNLGSGRLNYYLFPKQL